MPILVLDAREQVYYLKYQNHRADYLNALFDIIHWDNLAERFNAAIHRMISCLSYEALTTWYLSKLGQKYSFKINL